LREIDRRVRFLRKRLDVLNVVEHTPNDKSKIFFGAWVTMENEEGEEKLFRIVGPDEFDTREEYISLDSPLAKAMLGKSVDDEVYVRTPGGEICWIVVKVKYQ